MGSNNPESISLTSVGGMMLMFVGIFADISGIILSFIFYVGWILNIIIVIYTVCFFSFWEKFSKDAREISKKRGEIKKSIIKGVRTVKVLSKASKLIKWLKWIRPIVGAIPFLNIIPLWTLSAYLELKYPD